MPHSPSSPDINKSELQQHATTASKQLPSISQASLLCNKRRRGCDAAATTLTIPMPPGQRQPAEEDKDPQCYHHATNNNNVLCLRPIQLSPSGVVPLPSPNNPQQQQLQQLQQCQQYNIYYNKYIKNQRSNSNIKAVEFVVNQHHYYLHFYYYIFYYYHCY